MFWAEPWWTLFQTFPCPFSRQQDQNDEGEKRGTGTINFLLVVPVKEGKGKNDENTKRKKAQEEVLLVLMCSSCLKRTLSSLKVRHSERLCRYHVLTESQKWLNVANCKCIIMRNGNSLLSRNWDGNSLFFKERGWEQLVLQGTGMGTACSSRNGDGNSLFFKERGWEQLVLQGTGMGTACSSRNGDGNSLFFKEQEWEQLVLQGTGMGTALFLKEQYKR